MDRNYHFSPVFKSTVEGLFVATGAKMVLELDKSFSDFRVKAQVLFKLPLVHTLLLYLF